jgi:hypothetical protein
MIALGWGMAAAIGAIAGMLIAPVVFLEPNMMLGILLYGFAGAVLGGLTSPGGAVVGGFLVGVVENLVATYVPRIGAELKLPIALALIVVVLVLRPGGLFGRVAVQHREPRVGRRLRGCFGQDDQHLVARVLEIAPHTTVKDYENLLARLDGIPALVDQTLVLLKQTDRANAMLSRLSSFLRYTLVNNGCTYFSKAIHICFAGPIIAAFDRIIKQPIRTVTVIAIILGCVDATLCRDGVSTTRRILETKNFHGITKFCKRSCR